MLSAEYFMYVYMSVCSMQVVVIVWLSWIGIENSVVFDL